MPSIIAEGKWGENEKTLSKYFIFSLSLSFFSSLRKLAKAREGKIAFYSEARRDESVISSTSDDELLQRRLRFFRVRPSTTTAIDGGSHRLLFGPVASHFRSPDCPNCDRSVIE